MLLFDKCFPRENKSFILPPPFSVSSVPPIVFCLNTSPFFRFSLAALMRPLLSCQYPLQSSNFLLPTSSLSSVLHSSLPVSRALGPAHSLQSPRSLKGRRTKTRLQNKHRSSSARPAMFPASATRPCMQEAMTTAGHRDGPDTGQSNTARH